MPQQSIHVRVVREWLVSLGVLSAVSISRQEAELKLSAFVPMLMREFTDAAFTPESLSYVARRCKYFPTYGELCEYLSDWWREHRPMPPRLAPPPPEPEREPMTPEALARIHDLVLELAAEVRSPPLYQRPAATRHLSPEQLAEAYRNANVRSPSQYASAAAERSAVTRPRP
jgi:hypothetical protein